MSSTSFTSEEERTPMTTSDQASRERGQRGHMRDPAKLCVVEGCNAYRRRGLDLCTFHSRTPEERSKEGRYAARAKGREPLRVPWETTEWILSQFVTAFTNGSSPSSVRLGVAFYTLRDVLTRSAGEEEALRELLARFESYLAERESSNFGRPS
jgi:hypothetical protein